MLALRTAWEQQHGTGSVVGLAPSAVAAEMLAGDLGIKTENTARWWTLHIMTGSTFQTGQLVIVDEASLAGTLALDRITGAAAKAGAKILLVGDYGQLQSPAAAGAFGLLAGDRPDTPELSTIHRFTHEWEKTASLRLRLGEPDVIDVYQDADRIIGGTTDDMTARAYEAWRADREAGIESILVSDSGEAVAALNLRARTELILADVVNPLRGEVTLNGGVQAAVGDTVITRKNERKLRTRFSWVQNGNRWTITKVRPDGSVTVRPAGPGRGESIVLPADYVAQHLDLGCAVTAYRAQGVTTDTAHVLVEPTSTRETFYVAMTRGRHSNHAYVALDRADDHAQPHPGDDPHATARSVLYGVLQHSGPNSRRTRPSWPNRNSGAPSLNSPPSTRPSPPQLNTTAGPPSSGAPGSPRTRPRAPSSPRRLARLRPNCAAPKPTTTTSIRSCPASSPRGGSATPTTSPPSFITGWSVRQRVPQAPAGLASHRDSSPASLHRRMESSTSRCEQRSTSERS